MLVGKNACGWMQDTWCGESNRCRETKTRLHTGVQIGEDNTVLGFETVAVNESSFAGLALNSRNGAIGTLSCCLNANVHSEVVRGRGKSCRQVRMRQLRRTPPCIIQVL